MSTLLSLALLLAVPPTADSPAPVSASEVEGPAAPAPSVVGPAPDAPPADTPPADAPPPAVPPPGLGPDPDPEPGPDPEQVEPVTGPKPAISPGPGPVPAPAAPAYGTPAPVEDAYPERDLADMPYGATPARKSAVQRNNDVLVRPFSRPVYSIAASGRFGTLLAGGAEVVQPFGYGFAAQLRIHFVGVVKSRFGAEFHAGHARFSERRDFEGGVGGVEGSQITRVVLLTDTDFSAGPSMQIPLGPLFLQFGGSAGVALSTLFRPQSADIADDEAISTSNFMLRGGLSLGVPVLNRHGLTIGAGVHHIFSPREVVIEPQAAEPVTTRPFGTWLEILLGYQIWF